MRAMIVESLVWAVLEFGSLNAQHSEEHLMTTSKAGASDEADSDDGDSASFVVVRLSS